MRRILPILTAGTLVAASASGDTPKKAPSVPPAPPSTHAPAPAKKGGPVARAAKPQAPPPKYTQYVRTWHTPAADRTPALDAAGRPKLVLFSLNTNDRVELAATGDHGGFGASDLDRAAYVLREAHSGNEHPIEPRLLDVVYRIQAHFGAQEIRVVSGYRTPHGRASNHGKGRAIDVVVPGAADEDVARYAREIGFVGVGVYPSSGFVHVDVRDRSYFWVDTSGPGRRNRERGILGDLAKKSDQQALARGEHPLPPLLIGTDVDLALATARRASPAEPDDDDDDE